MRIFFLKVNNTIRFKFFNFFIANIAKIISKKITFATIPFCEQLVKITGAGKVHLDKNIKFGYRLGGHHKYGCVEIQARHCNSTIDIGENSFFNNNVFICSANLIKIGKNTLIGQNVGIMDFEAHGISPAERNSEGKIGTVIIEDNVWIGNNVQILKNTVIGKNSIVAAGAVVSGKFPDNVILGGVPAKIIRKL